MFPASVWTLVLLLCGFPACQTRALPKIRINPDSHLFVTPEGSVTIFHGVNAVEKADPYYPEPKNFNFKNSLSKEDAKKLQEWGLNVVRLGVMWPGVMPQKGQINATYLKVMGDIIDMLSDSGIYTIVDLHQDVMAKRFCGEGFPEWVVDELAPLETSCHNTVSWLAHLVGACVSIDDLPLNKSTDGFPDPKKCLQRPFFTYYLTPEVSSAFQKFYKNMEVQDMLKQYWVSVAKAFKDKPGVLGYDLINEPWPGDIWRSISTLRPGWTDRNLLQPLYQTLAQAIWKEDAQALIFYEGTPFPDVWPVVGGKVHSVGFEQGPGNPNLQVLSYHIYCCASGALSCDDSGNPKPGKEGHCQSFDSKKAKQRVADTQRLGGAGFLTEFGACTDTAECAGEITRVAANADEQFQSWAYWQYKYYDDITTQSGPTEGFWDRNGTLQDQKISALSRTYAQLIAGTPLSMNFDAITKGFKLEYIAKAQNPTIIYYNEPLHYPGGIHVDCTPAHGINAYYGPNSLTIVADSAVNVTVTITRKDQEQSGPILGLN